MVGATSAFTAVVPLVIAPVFRRLSEALGATGPSLAASVLQGWIPITLGVLPLALVALALAVPQNVLRRRVLLLLAFALTVLATAVLLIALYGTLFAAAGAAGNP